MTSIVSVALAGLAVLLVLPACTDDGPPPPAVNSAADAPVRSPTTTAPPPPALQRLDVSASVFGGPGDQRLTAVATAIGTVVAVGSDEGQAAVWRSTDGRGWDPVPLVASQFPPGSRLAEVMPGGAGYVAVGAVDDAPAAWLSPDGAAWRRAEVEGTDPGAPPPVPAAVAGGPLSAVVRTDAGLVAFGVRPDGGGTAVWRSVDGAVWRVVGGDPEVSDATVVAAAEAGGDVLALTGGPRAVAGLWTSPDARSWSSAGRAGATLLPTEGRPRPRAMLAAGTTLVAGGSADEPDGVDAALWTSTAGTEAWERVPHDEAVFGGDGIQAVTALVQDGGRLVAVGTDTRPGGGVDALLWVSQGDGWERVVEGDELAGAGDQHAADVTSTGRSVVAVGWETKGTGSAEAPFDTDAVAWVLGTTSEPPPAPVAGPVIPWRRVAGQDDLGGDGEQALRGVAMGPAGLVGVGTTSGDGVDAAVWRSVDGVIWARSALLGGAGDQYLLDVVAAPPGYVAVGSDGASAAVWLSADGETWSRAAGGLPVFEGGAARAVTVGPAGRLVAVGDDGAGAASAWVSDGGEVWQRAPIGPGTVDAVATGPSGLVAFGATEAGAVAWSSPDGLAWKEAGVGAGRVRGAVAGGANLSAVGSAAGDGLDGAAWTGAGADWEQSDADQLGGPDDQELTAVTVEEDLFVAVGWTGFGGGDDAACWASRDGVAWTRTPHDEEALGGDLDQRMEAVLMIEGTAVAVGRTGTDAAVWIAPDAVAGGSASTL